MKIFGFCQHFNNWVQVEIEVSLIPGLPLIHILGLPDQAVKESSIKIKSAMRSQNFEFPKAKQIIINIRGGDFKKKSPGLDLPMALAILTKTNQILKGFENDIFAFGELGLSGEVFQLEDAVLDNLLLDNINVSKNKFFSGEIDSPLRAKNHFQIKQLKDFKNLESINKGIPEMNSSSGVSGNQNKAFFKKRKIEINLKNQHEFKKLKFSQEEAKLLELVTMGRHSLLLMGPRGLGKSTLAEALNYLSSEPTPSVYTHYKKYFHHHGNEFWRPFVKPHHSISHLALIGGGAQCSPGEVTRAHGGILLLDEMLEFDSKCQEALREPIQTKEVHLVRGRKFHAYPSDFQLIATTNLCPCGQWLPGEQVECNYSGARCHKYREKLSGPMLDRFEILYFLKPSKKNSLNVPLESLREKIDEKRKNKESLERQREQIVFNKESLSEALTYRLDSELNSFRRLRASIEIAKTLAILHGKDRVEDQEMVESLEYTWQAFLELKI